MRRTHWLVVAVVALSAVLLSSCCCGRLIGRKTGVTIPTPGGAVTVKDGGKSTTITTPEGTVTTEQTDDKVTVKGDKGETMTFGQSVDEATIKKLDMPVYPNAEGQGSMDMSGSVMATFQTKEPFEDVASWYEKELGSGWDKSTMSSGDSKFTSFSSKDTEKKAGVTISADKEAVTIILTREIEKK
jgi:hypothetical protein